MSANWNWLQVTPGRPGIEGDEDMQAQMEMNGRSMPVFAGRK
jgi:hypothetical protein